MVQWIHKNRNEGSIKYAIRVAAANGHLNVVKWIHETVSGCPLQSSDLDYADEKGYSDVAEYLRANCVNCTE